MLIVGLTGGIATGKSTVTALLRGHGFTVLDCDEIAGNVIRQGRWGHNRVVKAFGSQILHADGGIDREKLGELVFKDSKARKKLNRATHLPVALDLARQLLVEWFRFTSIIVRSMTSTFAAATTKNPKQKAFAATLQIVDMPLLFETSANKLMWPRITVTCSHEAEVDRLVQRDSCTAEQAERKIAAQMPLHLKEGKSQFVLYNSGSRNHCQHQVLQLAKQLQGRYKLMGMATSPMTILGLVLVILKVVNSS